MRNNLLYNASNSLSQHVRNVIYCRMNRQMAIQDVNPFSDEKPLKLIHQITSSRLYKRHSHPKAQTSHNRVRHLARFSS